MSITENNLEYSHQDTEPAAAADEEDVCKINISFSKFIPIFNFM